MIILMVFFIYIYQSLSSLTYIITVLSSEPTCAVAEGGMLLLGNVYIFLCIKNTKVICYQYNR